MSIEIKDIKGGYKLQAYVSHELREQVRMEAAKRHRRITDLISLVMAEWLSGDRKLKIDDQKLSTNGSE